MKKIAFIIPVLILILSCGNPYKKEKEKIEKAMEELSGEKSVGDAASNCDEFLDNYEKWIDDYIELLGEYSKNPMDASLSRRYSEVAQEAGTWAQQWGALYTCAMKEKYSKRFQEISEKAQKKMEEMNPE